MPSIILFYAFIRVKLDLSIWPSSVKVSHVCGPREYGGGERLEWTWVLVTCVCQWVSPGTVTFMCTIREAPSCIPPVHTQNHNQSIHSLSPVESLRVQGIWGTFGLRPFIIIYQSIYVSLQFLFSIHSCPSFSFFPSFSLSTLLFFCCLSPLLAGKYDTQV